MKSLTALYTLILTIVAFIIEISPTWQSESMNIEYTIFCVLMYSIAILYFIYLYAYILYPIVFNTILLYLERMRVLNVHTVKRWVQPEPVFTGEGAGTLYLRLGTVCEFIISFLLIQRTKFKCSEHLEVSYGDVKSSCASSQRPDIIFMLSNTFLHSCLHIYKCTSFAATLKLICQRIIS